MRNTNTVANRTQGNVPSTEQKYSVEGFDFWGKYLMKMIFGRTITEITYKAYYKMGFNPREDLYITPAQ